MQRVLAVLAVAVIASAHPGGDTLGTPSEPVTVTPSGVIRGSWLQTRRGRAVEAYRGVRYAAPPVGDLRFQPPQPIGHYESEVDARREGPACPQPAPAGHTSEDCLRLNVYTRGPGSLPVIVYIHAGGFYSVSGRSDVAGPDYLLDEDVVLVTVNYRLASLGFLSTGDALAPGNNGFRDQVAALRWVQRNVAAFGGDPSRVTLAGYSAGSFSVALHMLSPMSKGLFHRAIAMSGSPMSQIALPPHQRHLADRQAQLLGCPTHSSAAMLACLRTKPADDFGNSLDHFFEYAYDPVLVWLPVVERQVGQEPFLAEQPLAALRSGRCHDVPALVGQTTDEFFWKAFSILDNATLSQQMDSAWPRMAAVSFLLPSPAEQAAAALRARFLPPGALRNDTTTAAGLGALYSDGVIGFGVHTLANALAAYSPAAVFRYEFAYSGASSHYTRPDTGRPAGVAHHDDLLYLFSVNASFPLIAADGTRDSRQVERMTRLWSTFAATGDPNPLPEAAAPHWPRYSRADRKYLRMGAEFSMREKLFEDRFRVWEELYYPPGCDYCTP